MAERFDIIFRGDIQPGQSILDVKERLANLFKQDVKDIDHLFSGKVQYLKRSVDQATSDKYRAALERAGAMVQIKASAAESVAPQAKKQSAPEVVSESEVASAAAEATAPEDPSDEELSEAEMSLAPVGADVLRKEERAEEAFVEVNTEHLSLEPVGADVLKESERKSDKASAPDTSHLSIKDD